MCCRKIPGLVVIKVMVTGVFCMVSGHVIPVDELTELLKTYWQSVLISLAFSSLLNVRSIFFC
ncbi:hypothetical protein BDF21DRAFT_423564 [Thamnidium elegans]|nr:hypothetical protein BDF21DRAFT_423564 [Thamnidium elegans]